MEEPKEDKDVSSLEGPDTPETPVPSQSTDSADVSNGSPERDKPPKKEKINVRIQNLITKVNVYLLIFIFIVILSGGIVIVGINRSRSGRLDNDRAAQQLTAEELAELSGSDVRVGDPKQVLTIESNAVFSGGALIRGSLDVAGEIRVGSALSISGLSVSGTTTLGQLATNDLTVSNNASIQGQLNVQRALSVSGNASFGGLVSAPQITATTLQVNGDLQLNRHIDAGGGTPSRNNGSALGSGGTTSISGTDTAGTLNVNTGSGPGAGCFATITFTQRFNDTPHVVITPVGSAGGSVDYYVNRSATNFSICTSSPPPAGSSFAFDYIVID